MSVDRNSLIQEMAALPWFHQIDFGGGVVSLGVSPLDELRTKADIYFPSRLDELTVLDIGCWDGFYSFEAQHQGAARVLATDHTVLDAAEIKKPVAVFYTDGYGGDGSNWWGPNRACVEGMLHRTGYSDIRFTDDPKLANRGIFHAKPG